MAEEETLDPDEFLAQPPAVITKRIISQPILLPTGKKVRVELEPAPEPIPVYEDTPDAQEMNDGLFAIYVEIKNHLAMRKTVRVLEDHIKWSKHYLELLEKRRKFANKQFGKPQAVAKEAPVGYFLPDPE